MVIVSRTRDMRTGLNSLTRVGPWWCCPLRFRAPFSRGRGEPRVVDEHEAAVVGRGLPADGEGPGEEATVHLQRLSAALDDVRHVGQPLGALDRAALAVLEEAAADLVHEVLLGAEEDHRVDRHRADLAPHLLQGVLEVGADAAGEEDGEVEPELGLALDELLGAVRHVRLDVRVLLLLVDVRAGLAAEAAEVDEHAAREEAELLRDAVADLHRAGAAAGDERERAVRVQQRVLRGLAHLEDPLEKLAQLPFKVALHEVGPVHAEEGRVGELLAAVERDEEPGVAAAHEHEQLRRGGAVSELQVVDLDAEVGEVDEVRAVLLREEAAVALRHAREDDGLQAPDDLAREHQGLQDRRREVLGQQDAVARDVAHRHGGEHGVLGLLVEVLAGLVEPGLRLGERLVAVELHGVGHDPVVRLQLVEDAALADEDARGAVALGHRLEGGGELLRVLGALREALAQRRRQVLAEGLDGEELHRDVRERLRRLADEDEVTVIARHVGGRLDHVGRRALEAGGQQVVADAAEERRHRQGLGAHHEEVARGADGRARRLDGAVQLEHALDLGAGLQRLADGGQHRRHVLLVRDDAGVQRHLHYDAPVDELDRGRVVVGARGEDGVLVHVLDLAEARDVFERRDAAVRRERDELADARAHREHVQEQDAERRRREQRRGDGGLALRRVDGDGRLADDVDAELRERRLEVEVRGHAVQPLERHVDVAEADDDLGLVVLRAVDAGDGAVLRDQVVRLALRRVAQRVGGLEVGRVHTLGHPLMADRRVGSRNRGHGWNWCGGVSR
eukprot:CAMPEP_0174842020 /NCGR_PEP_ID=MMETSP1114-20130205/9661_1 /TAXON_ID=312471 /ORGANISM="Neobodo designis, Strain CCAP 1951/1" /LENGTH=791 /DNA_ID=CAMNT_0016076217 /DNA_START=90 /DNA_END=2465 /DNA_ORIENTATION=-